MTHASPRRTARPLTVAALLAGLAAAAGLLWLGRATLSAQGPPPIPLLQLEHVAGGFSEPVYVTPAGDRSGRLFVVEQAGTIRIVRDGRVLPTPFLDIRSKVVSGGELGLLSVAFHPDYSTNGRFFVNYTTEQGGRLRSVIAEYRVSGRDANVVDAGSERILLEIAQPFRNHNGGLNLFGPDGMLYIGLGDGGSANDPMNNGQRLNTLLGKVLRIDVNGGTPYRVPPDNPFVGRSGARPEIWAYGLRNPWRFSFDRATGRLFVADVGQNTWEEIDIVDKGGNYGWRIMEGAHCHLPPTGCNTSGLEMPIAEYRTGIDGCAIIGGYVYRGTRIHDLVGRYVFGDYCAGRIWVLTETAGRWTMAQVLSTTLQISSFGEDQDGEIYVVDLQGGAIYRLAGR